MFDSVGSIIGHRSCIKAKSCAAKPVRQEQNWFVSPQHLGDGDFEENI